MPAIAHGVPNKKRKYASSDDETEEEGKENQAPTATDEVEGPKAKKVKTSSEGAATSPQKKMFKTGGGSRIPKMGNATHGAKGKGGLSLSRLNMLARPKDRR